MNQGEDLARRSASAKRTPEQDIRSTELFKPRCETRLSPNALGLMTPRSATWPAASLPLHDALRGGRPSIPTVSGAGLDPRSPLCCDVLVMLSANGGVSSVRSEDRGVAECGTGSPKWWSPQSRSAWRFEVSVPFGRFANGSRAEDNANHPMMLDWEGKGQRRANRRSVGASHHDIRGPDATEH